MKRTILGILLAIFLVFSVKVFATEVTDHIDGNVIELTGLDSADEDWLWTDILTANRYSRGVRIISIIFNTAAIDDICVFKEGSASGTRLWPAMDTADKYDDRVIYYHDIFLRPVLDISECTFSSGATITIIIDNR